MTATALHLSAAMVMSGDAMPRICARHGAPATMTRRVQLYSPAPGWSYLALLFGFVPFLLIVMATRKVVTSLAWPFCDECAATRRARPLIGLGLAALGAVCVAGVIVVGDRLGNGVVLLVLAAFLLLLGGFLVAVRGSWRSVSGGVVVGHGDEVMVRGAHPLFIEATGAVYQA